MKLPINEGKTDRIIRVVLGVVAIGLGFTYFSGVAQYIALIAGLVSLITGLTGFCALYLVFKINTLKK